VIEPAPAPARTRVPQSERRRQLLDVTLETLVSDGFESLSMEAIARKAGVNRRIVYRSFGNLQVLLLALLRREQRRIDAQIDALLPRDPGDRDAHALLVEALVGFLDAVQAHPLSWRLTLLPPESAPRALRTIVDRRRIAVERRLRRLVAWGAPQIAVPPSTLDIELLSRMLLSIVEEHGRLLLEDNELSRERLVASAQSLLGAIAWRRAA
jgi:AcrR family transcriptional regulator